MYNKVHFPLYLKTKPTNNRHKVASGQGFLQNICSAAHSGSVPCDCNEEGKEEEVKSPVALLLKNWMVTLGWV